MAGDAEAQTFSFEVVAVLIAALVKQGVTIGNKEYAAMVNVDPSKSVSGYQHYFRKVKTRAKEIAGDGTPSASPNSKNTKGAGEKSKTNTKRGHSKNASDGEDDAEAGRKKVKKEEEANDFEY